MILGIEKIIQLGFVEYHSKRRYAEWVRAAEDDALSRHGAFDYIYHDAVVGSKKHLENMEAMTIDVVTCR